MADFATVPLVIVEGFLSSTGSVLWGNFETYLNCSNGGPGYLQRRTIFVSIGPVSSLHDRACELFYALKGGTVDYGVDHSRRHSHRRFGRTHSAGLCPEWSQEHPLHFFGHSIGGPTIVKMQWLIAQGFFGANMHPSMVSSVTTVSAPFRGTQLVYTLGERTDGAPAVCPISVGAAVAKMVHVASYLSPLLPRIFDMHTESRALSYRETTFISLLRQLYRSDWAEGRDATPFDMTFQGAEERESAGEGIPHDGTFYRSYVACMTRRIRQTDVKHAPPLKYLLNLPLYVCSRLMGSFDFAVLRPVPAFMRAHPTATLATLIGTMDSANGLVHSTQGVFEATVVSQEEVGENHWANDGVVPTFSQFHPFGCRESRCHHCPLSGYASPNEGHRKHLVGPGIWDVHALDNCDHFSLVPLWMATAKQKQFWRDVGAWLVDIDDRRARSIVQYE
ncbi:alpha/beta-hydrolase [Punctularia strigosozonata HHB-11173 SS5]|uniref:alpha/beta-hydrolase n=1 Tax=Punctularia strigosozonata (strain HHB-11173) TaxID=741275 RepID=UPI0004416402|nr:alpha/beta-hydrolase [Punctularia strigosozonata HHB-11173 SS5]EIN14006.1 alpha/beta-hydrolase [Punctularia strigosozonata HHB-11173 SS5]